ncbi:methyltransferase domain-containing protein [Knoellia locipacati]|uniref:class I SAM-dependent methyltransferase n=1 Tax=Knoellia locipacati TaxID=882824 RepID=UPI00384E3739
MSRADEHLDAWEAWKSSPWGRIRFALVRDALDEAVASLGDQPLRILDVGGADGFETLPYAVRGHSLTVADPAEGFLDRGRLEAERLVVADRVHWTTAGLDELAEAGGTAYDVVICHFVLQYRPAGALTDDLAALAQVTRPGGLVSIVCPNDAGAVLRTLTRQGPAAARLELNRTTQRSHTFEHESRKLSHAEVAVGLADVGLREESWRGGRVANDLVADDDPKHDPDYFEELLALERELCRRDPYRGVGAFWQLTARRT